jgi:aspartate kinase
MSTNISVIKVGGSSINSFNKITQLVKTIKNELVNGYKIVLVVSAFRGVTDLLYSSTSKSLFNLSQFLDFHGDCAKLLSNNYINSFESQLKRKLNYFEKANESHWILDDILAMGETFSAQIIYSFLKNSRLKVTLKDFYDPDFPTRGYGEFSNIRIDLDATKKICTKNLINDLSINDCVIIPGMGCISDYDGRIRVRRGASDYVATSLSYGLKAKRLLIVSDVQGIKTSDSSIIPNAKTIPYLTVEELLDAGALGAKNTNTTFFLPLTKHCPSETYFAKYDDITGLKTEIITKGDVDSRIPVKLVAGREVLLYTFQGYDIEYDVLKLESYLSKTFDFIRGSGFKRERYFAFFDTDQKVRIDNKVNSYNSQLETSSCIMGLVGLVGEGMSKTKKIIERMGKALGNINIIYTLDMSRISVGVIVEREDLNQAIKLLHSDFIKG